MKSVSARELSGKAQRSWVKNRREMYRSILRDPRTSESQKAAARKRLETASPQK